MVSAITLVNGSLPPQNVVLGSTVTLALQDTAGVSSWSILCTSTDELNTVTAINATLSVNLVNFTATFTMPSTATGSAVQFTSIVNGDASTKETFGVYVATQSGFRLLFPGETDESSSQYGVIADINSYFRYASTLNASGPAGGDLSGNYPNPTVAKINGTAVTSAGGALTTGKVLKVTGVSSVDYGAVDLANANAVTGILPTGNQASQTMGGDASGITSAATVIKLRGKSLDTSLASLGATQDGYALTWVNGSSDWQAKPLSTFSIHSQTFTSSGTFVVPAGVTVLQVMGFGGGGGGGGGGGADNASGAGGGGSILGTVSINVISGNSYSVTVGAGGTAGSTNVPGGNGGDSSFGTLAIFKGAGGAGTHGSERGNCIPSLIGGVGIASGGSGTHTGGQSGTGGCGNIYCLSNYSDSSAGSASGSGMGGGGGGSGPNGPGGNGGNGSTGSSTAGGTAAANTGAGGGGTGLSGSLTGAGGGAGGSGMIIVTWVA